MKSFNDIMNDITKLTVKLDKLVESKSILSNEIEKNITILRRTKEDAMVEKDKALKTSEKMKEFFSLIKK